MNNVVSLNQRRVESDGFPPSSRAAEAYRKGLEAAAECYLPGLKQQIVETWLQDETFVMASWECTKDDPLYALACHPEYQRGVVDGIRKDLPIYVLIHGPRDTEYIRIGLCRSRLSRMLIRFTLWTAYFPYVRTEKFRD